jgi:hypothetical protein
MAAWLREPIAETPVHRFADHSGQKCWERCPAYVTRFQMPRTTRSW